MSNLASRDLKRAILRVLSLQSGCEVAPPATVMDTRPANKFNLLGRGDFSSGALEHHLGVKFSQAQRAAAARAFDELKRDGYIEPTYKDLVDPENWVTITSAGVALLKRDLMDDVDVSLEKIGRHLVELRRGMWDAIERDSPDAVRQAAHSARELISQLLKEGAPECQTRKERVHPSPSFL